MCVCVLLPNGKYAESIKELKEQLGYIPPILYGGDIAEDSCLCPVDWDKLCEDNNCHQEWLNILHPDLILLTSIQNEGYCDFFNLRNCVDSENEEYMYGWNLAIKMKKRLFPHPTTAHISPTPKTTD